MSFSKYETFAAPVAEAWAGGKPVVVSDKSGIAAYVNDELGVVVPADSEEELGKAMVSLYTDREQYSKSKLKSFAENHSSDHAIIGMLEKMYAEER